jgi:hypothetical protein
MIRQQPGRPGVNPLKAGGNAGGLEQGYQQPQGNQPKGLDLSSYSPGRAQPIQPPSQGTPFQAYNQQQGAPRSAPQFGGDVMFAGGTPYFNGRPGPMPRQQKAAPPRETPAVGAQPQVPFTQSAVGVGGQQFSDPSQAFAQRDALIQRINEARAPMFANSGMYMGGAAPPPPQPLDFNALLGQANEMVAGGWQNPFATPAQPSFSGLMAPPPEAYYPGGTMNDGYGMGGQQGPAPGYGTPPELRGGYRTADWRDADGDGVDDRDQDGPGMPPYPRPMPNPKGVGSGNWPMRPDGGLAPAPAPGSGAPPDRRGGSGRSAGGGEGIWKEYLSTPSVRDWALKSDGPAAENARKKMMELGMMPPSRPGQANPVAPPSQGAPQRRARSISEIAGDFYDPNPGGPKLMVVQDWHNPQTGEEYGGTGIAPRPGTGWMPGKSPVARLRGELDQADRNAAYQPPAEGTSRVDPGTGKAVTYSNGQWNWRPSPVSGVVSYDVSRFGDGTPAPPPPAAPAPQQPADPSAVTDLTSLPFYKSLFVGDTVRRMPNGQYQVLDWSGKPVEVYASNGTEPIIRTGKGRTGNTIWGSTPEGAAENAARLQRLMEEDAPRKQAQSADIDAKLKRLEELRTAALRRAKAGKFREGGFKSPEYREYNDLMNFASALDDDRTQWDQLTAQQRNMVRRLNPTAAF